MSHMLSCPETCGNLGPPKGIKLMSPALPSGFLTTGPPVKASPSILGPVPGARQAWGSRWAPCWLTHQGGHGKADDLEVAIVVPLGLKVMVLPRVAPGHGARTVPGGEGTAMGFRGQACRTGTAGPTQRPPLLTWGCSRKQCTGVSGPESWGSGQSHHTAGRNRRTGLRAYAPRGYPSRWTHPPLPAGTVHSPPRGCAWPSPWSCPSGSRRRLSVGDTGRHHLVTGHVLPAAVQGS